MSSYTKDNISTRTPLEHIRSIPTGYIVDVSVDGLWHAHKEILDNCYDETTMMNGRGKIVMCICRDEKNDTFQLITQDNGRGIPHEKLHDCFLQMFTSGKYDTKSYVSSSGQYGVGAKVTAALSRFFLVLSKYSNGISKLLIERGVQIGKINETPSKNVTTGTTVVHQPDDLIFTDIGEFRDSGYEKIVLLCQKFCIFGNTEFEFRINNKPLPPETWKADTNKALELVAQTIEAGRVIYNNKIHQPNPEDFLKEYWKTDRNFTWGTEIADSGSFMELDKDKGKEVERPWFYTARSYYIRYGTNTGIMGLVNNVPLDAPGSTHAKWLQEAYKEVLAEYITTPAMKDFFLTKYKLPLYHAVSLSRSSARLTGMTKHAYYDQAFEKIYMNSLKKQLLRKDKKDAMDALYGLLASDIEMKFNASFGTAPKDTGRLFLQLKNPGKFTNCQTKDRLNAELILCEGDSAGDLSGRDKEYQAMYKLRGKPYNGVTSIKDTKQSAYNIMNTKDGIYKDIFTLLMIDPRRPNFNNLNFGRIVLMEDADAHGYHINSLLVGNLWTACPELIERGIVHILIPPTYSIVIPGQKQKFFVKDEYGLNELRSKYMYYGAVDIKIRPNDKTTALGPDHTLTKEEYVDFASAVIQAGESIDRVADSMALDPRVIERLAYVVDHLSPKTFDLKKIASVFGGCEVTYDEKLKGVMIVLDDHDILVPLQGLEERLRKYVVPYMEALLWKDFTYYATTKYSDLYTETEMTIVEIFMMFKTLDSMFRVMTYKGIGGMNPEEKKNICYNMNNRQLYRITSIGDLERVYQLLGKNDSSHRKNLLNKGEFNDH